MRLRGLLSQLVVGVSGGQSWIRTSEGVSQRIYSPPRLATSVSTLSCLGEADRSSQVSLGQVGFGSQFDPASGLRTSSRSIASELADLFGSRYSFGRSPRLPPEVALTKTEILIFDKLMKPKAREAPARNAIGEYLKKDCAPWMLSCLCAGSPL